MSVFQPDTESGQRTATAPPEFKVVRKGYDREQVDAYVPKLVARVERAERANDELRREVVELQEKVPPTYEELGDDAATVLAEAGRSAELLIEKAKRRAETIVEHAQQEAERLRAEVNGKAQAFLDDARQEAERIRQEVQQERAVLDGEAEQVRQFRDGMIADLSRVHVDIDALLGRMRTQEEAAEPPVSGNGAPESAPPPDTAVDEGTVDQQH
jgi:cell division septum initiation protein DivIVA